MVEYALLLSVFVVGSLSAVNRMGDSMGAQSETMEQRVATANLAPPAPAAAVTTTTVAPTTTTTTAPTTTTTAPTTTTTHATTTTSTSTTTTSTTSTTAATIATNLTGTSWANGYNSDDWQAVVEYRVQKASNGANVQGAQLTVQRRLRNWSGNWGSWQNLTTITTGSTGRASTNIVVDEDDVARVEFRVSAATMPSGMTLSTSLPGSVQSVAQPQ